MHTQDNALYSQNLFLLALKGQITVEFIDGNTLEGEFAAQDALNIFVTVDETPIMIPRSQIRYIKGRPEQSIEEDHMLAAQPAASVISEPEPTQDIPDLDDTVDVDEDDDFDESERTMVLPEDSLETTTDSGTTETPADLFGTDFSDQLQPDDEDEDYTMVIEQTEVEEEEEDDGTFVLPTADAGSDTQEFAAYLDCITGPHAGEVFKMTPGVTTIGRSTDNILPLPKDKEISRKHTKITYEAGQFVVEDQGSLNGTFINNDRIEGPRYLEDGDVLMVGVSTLIYHKQ
jgi:hypothetical protein